MKFIGALATLALSTALVVLPQAARADIGDMRTGVYGTVWCGYQAEFNVTSRDGDSWVFHGQVHIKATGEWDEIRLEQMDGNALQIDRYLTGEFVGVVQSVRTFGPRHVERSGRLYSEFESRSSSGYGCAGTSTTLFGPP